MPLAQGAMTTWCLRFDLEELMKVGNRVRTVTDLPGIPAGTEGMIAEIGRVFIAVRFPDGRTGYYAPRQLVPVSIPGTNGPQTSLQTADLGLAGAQVPYGAHLCSLPLSGHASRQDVVQYLVTGVMRGDCCVAIVSPECQDTICRALSERGYAPERAKDAGYLTFLEVSDCYCHPDEFTADRQVERMSEALEPLFASGRPLRILGQVGPSAGIVGTDEWWEYEERITSHVERLRALALCDYGAFDEYAPLRREAMSTHQWMVSHGEVRSI